MEGIFTLPYSEYEAINQLQKFFKKKKGYSIFIPTSRQQKGIDFIIMNCNNNKILKVQCKSSRSYSHDEKKVEKNKKYSLWFNNFIKRYKKGVADIYLLFGLYPEYTVQHNIKTKNKIWKSIILVFEDKEMDVILSNVKTKNGKIDKFFGVEFDDDSSVYGSRGFNDTHEFARYLLKNKINSLLKKM